MTIFKSNLHSLMGVCFLCACALPSCGGGSSTNNLSQCIGGTCEWDGAERFNAGCL